MARVRLTESGLKTGAQQTVSEEMVRKASKCVKLAELTLGAKTEEAKIEEQAIAFMDMHEEAVEASLKRLGAEYKDQNSPKTWDFGKYPDSHPTVHECDELREPKGKKASEGETPCADCGGDTAVMALTEVPSTELEDELARRAAQGAAGEEEVMPEVVDEESGKEKPKEEEQATMSANKTSPQTPRKDSGEQNDPAHNRGRENQVDLPSVAEKSARLAAMLHGASEMGPTGQELQFLATTIAKWALEPKEQDLTIMAERAAKLANLLAPARKHSKLGSTLAHLASEVADGMISPDDGKPDQDNEENPSYSTNYEAPASDLEKAFPFKPSAGKRAADVPEPAKEVAPKDAPEERKIPKDEESTSEEIPGHSAEASKKSKKPAVKATEESEEEKEEKEEKKEEKESSAAVSADEETVEAPPAEEAPATEEEAPAEEAPATEEEIPTEEDEISFDSNSELSLDAALASDDAEEESTNAAVNDDSILDVLFEKDETKAAEKMASIQAKRPAKPAPVAKVASIPAKKGATKVGMGSKTASTRASEVQMLEKALWSSKPDVSKFFGQGK